VGSFLSPQKILPLSIYNLTEGLVGGQSTCGLHCIFSSFVQRLARGDNLYCHNFSVLEDRSLFISRGVRKPD